MNKDNPLVPYMALKQVLAVVVCSVWVVGIAPAVQAQTGGPYTISPQVVASGGQTSASTDYSLQSTVGQPAVDNASSAGYSACSGYWCSAGLPAYRSYLPLTARA